MCPKGKDWRKTWIQLTNDTVKEAIAKRRSLRIRWLRSRDSVKFEQYKAVNRLAQRKIREAKFEYIESQLEEYQRLCGENQWRQTYKSSQMVI